MKTIIMSLLVLGSANFLGCLVVPPVPKVYLPAAPHPKPHYIRESRHRKVVPGRVEKRRSNRRRR